MNNCGMEEDSPHLSKRFLPPCTEKRLSWEITLDQLGEGAASRPVLEKLLLMKCPWLPPPACSAKAQPSQPPKCCFQTLSSNQQVFLISGEKGCSRS